MRMNFFARMCNNQNTKHQEKYRINSFNTRDEYYYYYYSYQKCTSYCQYHQYSETDDPCNMDTPITLILKVLINCKNQNL